MACVVVSLCARMFSLSRFAMKRSLLLVGVIILVGGSGLVAPSGLCQPADDDFFAVRKNFTIFGRLYEELAAGYVDPLEAEQLMRTGIDAMLATLDPYTVFIDEADNEDIDIITRGRYGGVGLGVDERGGRLVVVVPFEGYSAYEQGVRAGDVIAKIGGLSAEEMSSLEARNLLRGAPGTTVSLEIEREGEPGLLSFVLTRSEIHLNNVTYSGWAGDQTDGIGYARLERFTQEAGNEMRQAIERLRSEQGLEGFVLELRGNPGGLLEAAVDVAGMFLSSGKVVVSTRGRAVETERTYRTRGAPVAPDVPLVVLVDGSSASASEIVAGALQDHDRAIIVGETTFGKGLVQVVRSLPYNTSLKLTTARYYTPSGRLIQAVTYGRDGRGGTAERIPDSLRHPFLTMGGRTVYDGHGIEPDVTVSLGEISDLEEALRGIAAFFFFANHYAAEHSTLPTLFTVDDDLMDEFRNYLGAEDFTYLTRAERMLDELVADLDDAGYHDALDEVADLREEIADEKEDDFDRHAPRLRERLRREILARYVGQSDQIRLSLDIDPQLARALDLLGDHEAYLAVLDPR